MQQRWPSLAEDIMSSETIKPLGGGSMMLSGAAAGADTTWGRHALQSGYSVVHFVGRLNHITEEAQTSQAQCILDLSRGRRHPHERRSVCSIGPRGCSAAQS